MEFSTMTTEALLERANAIGTECEAENADLDALTDELRGIKAELEARKAAEAKRAEIRAAVADGAGNVTETIEITEDRKMANTIEIRNTPEYIDAYAEYIKTGNDAECRALITENTTNGTVPVPEFVYDIVKTAWNREGIMSRVRKSYLKGNLKVGFEISGTDAVVHTEGQTVDEETLVLGVVNLVPQSIKKWINCAAA